MITDLEPDFARDIFGSAFDISGGGIATISQSAWAGVFIIAFLIAFVRGVFWFWRMGTTTQPTVVNEGKGNLLQIVRGVLVVVGLPLLVFSLNPDMLRATFAIPAIRGLQLVGQGSVAQPTETKPPTTALSQNEQLNRDRLKDAGIGINKSACSPGQTENCTNTAGWPQETIDMLIQLKKDCPACSITVTGGTEPGHKSHGVGKRPVDIRITSSFDPLYKHIVSSGRKVADASFCFAQYSYNGWTFCDENVYCTLFYGSKITPKINPNDGVYYCLDNSKKEVPAPNRHWHVY